METEFRGKRLDNGKLVFGDKLTIGKKVYIVNNYDVPVGYYFFDKPNGDRINLCGSMLSCLVEVDPASVGMFTGKMACDKRKIFAGDMVGNYSVLGVVCWDENRAGFLVKHKDKCYALTDIMNLSISGNMTDTPELMEAK